MEIIPDDEPLVPGINSFRLSDAYICISIQTIIGSDNGLLTGRQQAIIWTTAGILLMGFLGTNVNRILTQNTYILIKGNPFENIIWKMVVILSQPQCVNPSEISWDVRHNLLTTDGKYRSTSWTDSIALLTFYVLNCFEETWKKIVIFSYFYKWHR